MQGSTLSAQENWKGEKEHGYKNCSQNHADTGLFEALLSAGAAGAKL